MRSRSLIRALQAFLGLTCWLVQSNSPALAVPRTWIGGSTTWNNNVDPGNWTPAGEPSSTDDAFFVSPDTVTLGNTNAVFSLSLSGGGTLDLGGQDLTVDGLVHLEDASSRLIVGGTTTLLQAQNLTIETGAAIIMTGGQINMDEVGGSGFFDVTPGGLLTGHGTINLTDTLVTSTRLLRIGGALIVQSDPLVPVDPPPAATLLISATSSLATIDLDGAGVTGSVTVGRNQTLDIDLPLSDAFGGAMNLQHNSTLDIALPWTLDVGSITISTGAAGLVPAGIASIGGGTLTQTGGLTTVADPDGALQFNAPFTQNGGTLQIGGRVILNASSKIAAAATVNGAGSLVVSAGGTLVGDDGAVIDVRLRNEGTLSPSGNSSVGELSIKQLEQAAGGKLIMQFQGFGAGQADRIIISESAEFGGELHVGRIGGFVPEPGESFVPITYDSHSGSFDIINATGLAGLTFIPAYGAGALTLTAAAHFPGDADLSGRVDVKDLAALATNWLTSSDWFGGDFNGDGFVDKQDLGLMALNWHFTAPGLGGLGESIAAFGLPASAIPEPASAPLLFGCLLLRRRR